MCDRCILSKPLLSPETKNLLRSNLVMYITYTTVTVQFDHGVVYASLYNLPLALVKILISCRLRPKSNPHSSIIALLSVLQYEY